MAPSIPEEIDVFTRPHSRMKELVNNFTKKMLQADLSHAATLSGLVSELHATLLEFRRHEAIENVLILDRLRQRIRQRRKRAPPHLGTCHDDDALPRLFEFVRWCEGVLGARGDCGGVDDNSCADVGDRLHSAYTHFLTHFLPHMKQEEQEFQPLLMTHFEYNELKALKMEVWQQHELYTDQLLKPKEERPIPPAPQHWTRSSIPLKTDSRGGVSIGSAGRKHEQCPEFSNEERAPDVRSPLLPTQAPRLSLRASSPAKFIPPPFSIGVSSTLTNKGQSGILAAAQTDLESLTFAEVLRLAEEHHGNKAKTCTSPTDVTKIRPKGPYVLDRTSNKPESNTSLLGSSDDYIHQGTELASSSALGLDVFSHLRRHHVTDRNAIRGAAFENVGQLGEEVVELLLTFMPPNGDVGKCAPAIAAQENSNDQPRPGDLKLCDANASKPSEYFAVLQRIGELDVAKADSDNSVVDYSSTQAALHREYETEDAVSLSPEDVVTDQVFLTKSSKELYNRQHLPYNNDLDYVTSVPMRSSIDDKCSTNEPTAVKFTNQPDASESFLFHNKNIPALHRSHYPRDYSSNAVSSLSSSDNLNWDLHHPRSTSNNCTLGTQSLNVSGGVKLDTTVCVAGSPGLAVTRVSASLLVLSHEVLLHIMRFLSPRDLARLACVSQALNVVAFDKSLWRQLMPTQWARGMWSWRDLRLGDALEDQRCLEPDDRLSSSRDEDADEDTTSTSSCSLLSSRRHRAVLRGLANVVCRRTGAAVHTIVLDGAGSAVCSRALNAVLAKCPNLVTLSAAYCSIDYFTFKGLWQRKALRQLETLDLRGCEKLDDAALNCLAMCADRPYERQHAPSLARADGTPKGRLSCSTTGSSSSEDISSSASSTGDGGYCDPCKDFDDEGSSLNSGNEDEQEDLLQQRCYDNYKRWLGVGSEATHDSGFPVNAEAVTNSTDRYENLQQFYLNDDCSLSNDSSSLGSVQDNVGDDDGYGSVRRNSMNGGLVRWNYHPTQVDTVRVSSYLSSVIQTNFSVTKLSTSEQSGPRSSSNQTSKRPTSAARPEHLTGAERQSSLRYLNLSGCRDLTGVGLDILSESGFLYGLQEADLSGCDLLTSDSLNNLVLNCPDLPWTSVAYCDNIQGANGDQEAGGCGNLGNPLRHCCRSGK